MLIASKKYTLQISVGRGPHHHLECVLEGVSVLLQEAWGRVVHILRIVLHNEALFAQLLDREELVWRVVLHHLVEEAFVASTPEGTLLVEKGHDTTFAAHHLETGSVIGEDDGRYIDAFCPAFIHITLEDVGVVVVLETFVGKVDAELFEGVYLKVFEAEDIEEADPVAVPTYVEEIVAGADEGAEFVVVEMLGEGVAAVGSLDRGEETLDRVAADIHDSDAELALHDVAVDFPQLDGRLQSGHRGGLDVAALAVRVEFDVLQVQNTPHNLPHRLHLLLGLPNLLERVDDLLVLFGGVEFFVGRAVAGGDAFVFRVVSC